MYSLCYVDERAVVMETLVQTLQLPPPELLQKILHDHHPTYILRQSEVGSLSAHHPPVPIDNSLSADQTIPCFLEKRLSAVSLSLSANLVRGSVCQHIYAGQHNAQS